MFKNKYVIVGIAAVVVLGLSGGAFAALHGKHHTTNNQLGAAFDNQQTAAQSGDSSATSLNQSASGTSSGLSVGSSSGAGSLGQLNSQSGSQSSGSSGSSSSSSNPVDPSTFSQYDKYKDSQNALMGDIQAGTGTELTAGHTASVYYKGWLTNGTLFDATRTGSDGQPQAFSFTLGSHQVISGWEEGLAGMKVGGTRLVIVPPAVGYGDQAQASIPANSVLIFEVQLLAVQ